MKIEKKFCPKCGSDNIKDMTQIHTYGQSAITYKCDDCGYEGEIYLKKTNNKIKDCKC